MQHVQPRPKKPRIWRLRIRQASRPDVVDPADALAMLTFSARNERLKHGLACPQARQRQDAITVYKESFSATGGLARHGCRGQLQHPLAAYTQTLAQRIVNVMLTLFNDTVGFQEHAPTFSQHSVVSTG